MAPPAVLSSFWDRLAEPLASRPTAQGATVAKFEQTVLRHVEALLNERRPYIELPERFRSTILGYGLAELTSFDFSSPLGATAFAAAIADAVRRFEPRLQNVSVVAVSGPGTFRIRAELLIQGIAERVEFQAEISSDTAWVTVGHLGHPGKG